MVQCSGCNLPIVDKYLLKVLDCMWHTKCLQCYECNRQLTEKCYSRDGKLYCAKDFYRRYGTKCSGCNEGISPTDLVRRAKDMVFHVECFRCSMCLKEIATGDELYHVGGTKFVCKEDYNLQANEMETSESPKKSDAEEVVKEEEEDGILDEDGENGPNGKRRGPRTTIKAKQLEILKSAFSATPKPTRHMREKLAQETGLSMRVIQVWFQNRRSKERRLNNSVINGAQVRGGKSRRSPRKGSESHDLLEGMVNALLDPSQCAFQTQDLLNSPDYYGNRTIYPPCDPTFETHQRMDDMVSSNMMTSENGYGRAGLLRGENGNTNYMKIGQHSTSLHHNPLPGQESHGFGGNTQYAYTQSNNLHMNTVTAMW